MRARPRPPSRAATSPSPRRRSRRLRPRTRRRETRRDSDGPVRTCVGCGRKAAKTKLVRFVAVDGVLTQGDTLPGRGAYTCRSLDCLERALARRGFARGLRAAVKAGPELSRLYTGDSHG